MKNCPYLIVLLGFLTACGGNETTSSNNIESLDSSDIKTDTILTVTGMLDGPDDEWFYVQFPDSIYPAIKEIHIVPVCGPTDSALTQDYMFSITQLDYMFYEDKFRDRHLKVKVYYDGFKQVLLTEYQMVSGGAEGRVDVFNPLGEKLVSRDYENGTCIKSYLDLYAVDWTFNPKNSSLMVQDYNANVTTNKDGVTTLRIGPSLYASGDGSENDQFDMIRKDVFENDFFINGSAYTGCLMGHFQYSDFEPETYYELNFVNGKLHDTIRVYGGWGLELEEVYANGDMIEVLYQAEEMDGMAKPVIYLYPETEMLVNVQLDLNGIITHSYPKYPADGWNVKAQPDGTLYNENGKEFYALFWEGTSPKEFTYTDGFVVKGADTEKFLESSLEIIGLTRREANEFIMFWLPQMENNAYNLIHFSTDEYQEIAQLKITPKPESILRIMMVWSPLEQLIEIPQQNLYDLNVERRGFTVVEWGGKKQEYLRAL
jgi:hypothetical protein